MPTMNMIEVEYVGIDSFNRPIFKSEMGNFYGSCDKLFHYSASEEEVLMNVTVQDLCRAKNRVREHGSTFNFRQGSNNFQGSGKHAVMVESQDGSWFGWFDENEADWRINLPRTPIDFNMVGE